MIFDCNISYGSKPLLPCGEMVSNALCSPGSGVRKMYFLSHRGVSPILLFEKSPWIDCVLCERDSLAVLGSLTQGKGAGYSRLEMIACRAEIGLPGNLEWFSFLPGRHSRTETHPLFNPLFLPLQPYPLLQERANKVLQGKCPIWSKTLDRNRRKRNDFRIILCNGQPWDPGLYNSLASAVPYHVHSTV